MKILMKKSKGAFQPKLERKSTSLPMKGKWTLSDYYTPLPVDISTRIISQIHDKLTDYADICHLQQEALQPQDSSLIEYEATHRYLLNQIDGLVKKRVDDEKNGMTVLTEDTMVRFFEIEKTNKVSNQRLKAWRDSEFESLMQPHRETNILSDVVSLAQQIIADILGECPDIKDSRYIKFGPGVTVGTNYGESHALAKLTKQLTVSPGAFAEFFDYNVLENSSGTPYSYSTLRGHSNLDFTFNGEPLFDVDVVTQVPKNNVINRVIAKTLTGNALIQSMIGGEMTSRFQKKTGVDLSDQSVNQRLAYVGSKEPSRIATIDMSDASSLICYEAVRTLITDNAWFNLLDASRVGEYVYSDHILDELIPWSLGFNKTRLEFDLLLGEKYGIEKFYPERDDLGRRMAPIEYQLFSAMGNGYTFPLESIIFYSLARAVTLLHGLDPDRHRFGLVKVYGDDIICHPSIVKSLDTVFRFFGFDMNLKKSFFDETPFRESCGKDYWRGTNVRSFYFRSRVSPAVLVAFANFLLKKSEVFPICGILHRFIKNLILVQFGAVGIAFLVGPPEKGDGHMHDKNFIPKKETFLDVGSKKILSENKSTGRIEVFNASATLPETFVFQTLSKPVLKVETKTYKDSFPGEYMTYQKSLAGSLPGFSVSDCVSGNHGLTTWLPSSKSLLDFTIVVNGCVFGGTKKPALERFHISTKVEKDGAPVINNVCGTFNVT